ncbi:Sm-like protein LSM1B [Sesamum alatum]|uniref:Sm-like protein LSM1B n=1 Tax=Sesamum alatum TaxID=300844 RepID=A0AAE1XLT5_9LAMI|nr:Sm-like protein LSM1B [Sesamum alatum]
MKFFNWMQSKFSSGQGDKRATSVPDTNHKRLETPNEEFSDWPHSLLTIGTLGNKGLTDKQEIVRVDQNERSPQEEQCSSPDLSEFTAEEVGKLQKELTKLLRRKPAASKPEEPMADLPLDRFLNCPSSLEVDRTVSDRFSTYSVDDKDEEEIDRTIRIILGRCKDVCEKKKKTAIGKRSLSFLVKKMFVCSSGFVPTPSLRDTLQESRMEKLLRTMLSKKIYQRTSSRPTSTKKCLEDSRPTTNAETEDESHDKCRDGSKWDKTDSECPEDVYLSTSLASYLDKKLLVLLRDGRKLLGILRSFDQFANAVLEGACERVIVGELYCDIPLGLYVIRGENVVLIGELDLDKEELPPHMTRVSAAEIKRAQKAEREASELKGTMKKRMDFLDMD